MFMPPLPAIRNFRPTEGMASKTSTRTPPAARTSAAISPAGPPPTTATREVSIGMDGGHGNGHFRLMAAAAENDAALGGDVAEVTAEGNGDVLGIGQQVVGGIEVDPALPD